MDLHNLPLIPYHTYHTKIIPVLFTRIIPTEQYEYEYTYFIFVGRSAPATAVAAAAAASLLVYIVSEQGIVAVENASDRKREERASRRRYHTYCGCCVELRTSLVCIGVHYESVCTAPEIETKISDLRESDQFFLNRNRCTQHVGPSVNHRGQFHRRSYRETGELHRPGSCCIS